VAQNPAGSVNPPLSLAHAGFPSVADPFCADAIEFTTQSAAAIATQADRILNMRENRIEPSEDDGKECRERFYYIL
jgi:hypothetical protein